MKSKNKLLTDKEVSKFFEDMSKAFDLDVREYAKQNPKKKHLLIGCVHINLDKFR